MIKLLTKVNIIDNTGGIIGRCIKILRPKNVKEAKIGDIILVTIVKSLKTSNIKKGDLFKAIVVRTKAPYKDFQ
jgi:large subunit ribosomal protein L14